MSATIILLPTVPVVRTETEVAVTMRLSRRQYDRLHRHARSWGMTPDAAAAAILDQYFKSVRDR